MLLPDHLHFWWLTARTQAWYGGTRWSYGAALAVRTKGCLVAIAAPSRSPRVLSV
ncbi:hypothetical protein ERO13_A12G151100v2 [Gossypium hirsutum]|nr:hypothetical protein ERO13_A12G151100v2 [Gossypium hirsutum]